MNCLCLVHFLVYYTALHVISLFVPAVGVQCSDRAELMLRMWRASQELFENVIRDLATTVTEMRHHAETWKEKHDAVWHHEMRNIYAHYVHDVAPCSCKKTWIFLPGNTTVTWQRLTANQKHTSQKIPQCTGTCKTSCTSEKKT